MQELRGRIGGERALPAALEARGGGPQPYAEQTAEDSTQTQ